MSRLTNKDDRGRYYTVEEKILIANEPINPTTTWITNNENRRYGSPIDKLGKLEDLEEQLGCSLEVVFKALGHCIYDEEGNAWYIEHYYQEHNVYQLHSVRNFGRIADKKFNTKDYKKTWWLKEDKSE